MEERARLKRHEKEGGMQPDPCIVEQLAPMFSIKVSRTLVLYHLTVLMSFDI